MSPPYSGPVMTFRDVVLGGWISYVTSLCQSSNFEKADGSGRRAASLYTTMEGVSAGLHQHRCSRLTVNFLESGFLGDWGCRMFVGRTKMPRNVKLFVDVQFLVSEDCRKVSAAEISMSALRTHDSSLSSQESSIETPSVRYLVKIAGRTDSSSFWAGVSCLRSTPVISVPIAGVRC